MPLPAADSAALDVAIYLMFSEDNPVVVESKSKSRDKNNFIRRRLLVGSDYCCKCSWTGVRKSSSMKEKLEGITPRYKFGSYRKI